MRDDMSRQAPNPFPKRRAANALTALHTTPGMGSPIVTNPLNEQQEQVLQERESAQRRTHIMATLAAHSDYVFTPLSIEELLRQNVGQLLVSLYRQLRHLKLLESVGSYVKDTWYQP